MGREFQYPMVDLSNRAWVRVRDDTVELFTLHPNEQKMRQN